MTPINSEYPGVLALVHVNDGDSVEKGERVADIELMKTQFPLVAPVSGIIRFRVELGSVVSEGELIAEVE